MTWWKTDVSADKGELGTDGLSEADKGAGADKMQGMASF
jgi:hypothetical protein